MKVLKIPENTNELRDYREFLTNLKEINFFMKNINQYMEKIVGDEYLKTRAEWEEILSPQDLDKINFVEEFKQIQIGYDYFNNKFEGEPFKFNFRNFYVEHKITPHLTGEIYNQKYDRYFCRIKHKLETDIENKKQYIFRSLSDNKFYFVGDQKIKNERGSHIDFNYNDDKIIVKFKQQYKEHHFPGWLPWKVNEDRYEINLHEKKVIYLGGTSDEVKDKYG